MNKDAAGVPFRGRSNGARLRNLSSQPSPISRGKKSRRLDDLHFFWQISALHGMDMDPKSTRGEQ